MKCLIAYSPNVRTIDTLKSKGIDYMLASIEDGQLVLEPFCSCGTILDEH